jgi:hypothetical protein
MLQRLTINISTTEQKALETVAAIELRGTRDQARLILRKELERRGFLTEGPCAGQQTKDQKCESEGVSHGQPQ